MTYLIIKPFLRSIFPPFIQQILNSMTRKSWRVFNDGLLLERCFRGFVLPVLEYCSAEWCSAADTHLKLLACQWRQLLNLGTGRVLECCIAHRRSIAVSCMLYTSMCNPMYSLYGALRVPDVPVRVTLGRSSV